MTTKMVHSKIIRDACDLYLEAREERINAVHESILADLREPYRKWFRWRHRTPSQAIQAAKENEEWWDCQHVGLHWANRAESLRSLARAPGADMISLDREDALFLEPWIDLVVNQ